MENQIRKNIEQNIQDTIESQCAKYEIKKISPHLHQSLKEYSLRKGKRIRPLLFLFTYLGYSPKRLHKSFYNVSTAIEFLHNFMLIHDDIIDNSHLRRGKPTMHKLLENAAATDKKEELGHNLAIIAGDIIYAFAIEAFLALKEEPARKEKALRYFLETTTITALGELTDTLQGFAPLNKVKEEDVFLNYSLKTARYTFISPAVLGAILAGARAQEIQRLTTLCLEIGHAFQIQDDVIGIFGTEEKIGKSILSDLEESKKTLLVCHCFHHLGTKKKNVFTQIFNKEKKNLKDLQQIRDIFTDTGSLEYCVRQIETKFNQSLRLLEKTSMKKFSMDFIRKNFIQFFSQTQKIADQYNITVNLIQE